MAKYITKQRKILQDYLSCQIDQELSAKKVAEDLKDQGVSLSAIYRNLGELEKEKMVVQCHKEGSREFYFRYVATPDCLACFHLSCKICGKINHISHEDSHRISQEFQERYAFALDLPNTVFYGVCQQCSGGS